MSGSASKMTVRRIGSELTIRCEDAGLPGDSYIVQYREKLRELVEDHHPTAMTFDVSGIACISSSTLGVLFGFFKSGVAVKVYRPTGPTRDVLRVTQLEEVFAVVEQMPEETE